MKKIVFLTLLSALMMGSCARTFHSYVADGKGGTYRIGGVYSTLLGMYTNRNYVEHCKVDAGALKCREVKISGPGLGS